MSGNISFERITSPGIFVAGIAVRTTNQDGRAQTDIGNLVEIYGGKYSRAN